MYRLKEWRETGTNFPITLLSILCAVKLELDELITNRFNLDEMNKAFKAMKNGELIRVIVELS